MLRLRGKLNTRADLAPSWEGPHLTVAAGAAGQWGDDRALRDLALSLCRTP